MIFQAELLYYRLANDSDSYSRPLPTGFLLRKKALLDFES